MVKKIIQFAAEPQDYLGIPKPAKRYIPDWYKKSERYVGGKPQITRPDGAGRSAIKACVPFMDAYLNGYVIELWQDIEVVQKETGTEIFWNTSPFVLTERSNIQAPLLPVPPEYSPKQFIWNLPFAQKTPPGYSVLVTHPLNRWDLPFTTFSAIIDTDSGMHPGNMPVLFKNNFEGIIPQGTPIAQVIPIKRESWEAVENQELLKKPQIASETFARRVISGWYRDNFWKKKDFI